MHKEIKHIIKARKFCKAFDPQEIMLNTLVQSHLDKQIMDR